MKKFNTDDYINKLSKLLKNGNFPVCPYCGGNNFTTTQNFASIIASNDFDGINISTSIPCGMIICQKCGHIEFFALGALGLIPPKEVNENESKK